MSGAVFEGSLKHIKFLRILKIQWMSKIFANKKNRWKLNCQCVRNPKLKTRSDFRARQWKFHFQQKNTNSFNFEPISFFIKTKLLRVEVFSESDIGFGNIKIHFFAFGASLHANIGYHKVCSCFNVIQFSVWTLRMHDSLTEMSFVYIVIVSTVESLIVFSLVFGLQLHKF